MYLNANRVSRLICCLLIGTSLTACVPMPGDGAMGDRPAAPVPMAPPIAPRQPLNIQDPEVENQEWEESIVAQSPEEAERECRARAKQYKVELVRVQQPSKVKRGQNQQYTCWFLPSS